MDRIDLDLPIENLGDVASTRAIARAAVQSGDLGHEPRLFIATTQSEATGRFDRAWACPKGGLWCTLAWPLRLDVKRVREGLGLRLGLACLHAIEHVLAVHGRATPATLKWPNDVLVGGKRVAGVLAEILKHEGKPYVLVHVFINANFDILALPEELHGSVTTLQTVVGSPVRMERLVDDVRVRLRDALMTEGLSGGHVRDVRKRLNGMGEEVTINLSDGSQVHGTVHGVTDAGMLQLNQDGHVAVVPPTAEFTILEDQTAESAGTS